VALQTYIDDTADLLRDPNHLFWSISQLTRYINLARYQLVKITACLPILISGQSPFGSASQAGYSIPGATIPGMLPGNTQGAQNASGAVSTSSNGCNTIPGVEQYPFTYFNRFLQAANAGADKIIDVMDCAVAQGGIRPAMSWIDFSSLQAYMRSYNLGVTSFPYFWSTFGDGTNGQLWLFPVPIGGGYIGEIELLVSASPKQLFSNNDVEIIPDNFRDAIPFRAAFLANMNAQKTGAANLMLNYFNDLLGIARVSSDRGKVQSYYFTDI
jgi:hypothetical protein